MRFIVMFVTAVCVLFLISTYSWIGCYSIAGLPPALNSATHLYTRMDSGNVRVKCLPKNTTQCPRTRLSPRPLNPRRVSRNTPNLVPRAFPLKLGGAEILLVASCYWNRDRLGPDEPLGWCAEFSLFYLVCHKIGGVHIQNSCISHLLIKN